MLSICTDLSIHPRLVPDSTSAFVMFQSQYASDTRAIRHGKLQASVIDENRNTNLPFALPTTACLCSRGSF